MATKDLALMAVLTLAISLGCGRASEPHSSVVETVEPAQKLRQMSEKLAQARR